MIRALVLRFPIWTAVGIFALGGFIFRDFVSGSVRDLKVGDCFDVPTGTSVLKDVQHHPCSDAHGAEMIFIGGVTGDSGTFPGVPAFQKYALDNCRPAYGLYSGRAADTDQVYKIVVLYPTADSWKTGDRAVNCFATRRDGVPTTGTLRVQ
jgi:hypothetical protein